MIGIIEGKGQKKVNGKTLTKYHIDGKYYSTFKDDEGNFEVGDTVEFDFKQKDQFNNLTSIGAVDPKAPKKEDKEEKPKEKPKEKKVEKKPESSYTLNIKLQNAAHCYSRLHVGKSPEPDEAAEWCKAFVKELYMEDD